jgi:hypothetical protein
MKEAGAFRRHAEAALAPQSGGAWSARRVDGFVGGYLLVGVLSKRTDLAGSFRRNSMHPDTDMTLPGRAEPPDAVAAQPAFYPR